MLKKGLLLLGVLVMASIFATGFEILYSMDEYAYDVYPRSLYIKGWVMYGISQKEFYVFDISSPSKIEVVKKIDLYDFLEGDIMKVITGYGERLYILGEKSIIVYDISNPELPKLVAKKKLKGSLSWMDAALEVKGKILISKDTSLLMLDLSSNELRSVTRIPLAGENMQYSEEKSLLVIPTSKGTAFLVLDLEGYVPKLKNKKVLGDEVNYVWIDGRRVYAVGKDYLYIFDISDPYDPEIIRKISMEELIGNDITPYLPSVFAKNDVVVVFAREKSRPDGRMGVFDMKDPSSPKVLCTKGIRTEVENILPKGNLLYFIESSNIHVARISYERKGSTEKPGGYEYQGEEENVPSELIECKAYFIYSRLKKGNKYRLSEFVVYNKEPRDEYKLFSLKDPGEIRKFVSYSPTRLCVMYRYEQESAFGMNGMTTKCWKCKSGVLYKIVAHPYADDPQDLVEFLPEGAY